MGFISYPVEHDKLMIKEVIKDQLVIITPPDQFLTRQKKLAWGDLAGQLLIMHEKGSAPRASLENYMRQTNLSLQVALELSSNRAIKRAVEEGIGIALISRKVALEEIESGRLIAIPLFEPSMTRKFYMIHHKDKYLSESLQNFMATVMDWAAEYTAGLT